LHAANASMDNGARMRSVFFIDLQPCRSFVTSQSKIALDARDIATKRAARVKIDCGEVLDRLSLARQSLQL
jgi:hypothetical protein